MFAFSKSGTTEVPTFEGHSNLVVCPLPNTAVSTVCIYIFLGDRILTNYCLRAAVISLLG